LDFSKNGRRITEGPPDMIFLKLSVEVVKCMETCARGGEYELHGNCEQANRLTLGRSRNAYIVLCCCSCPRSNVSSTGQRKKCGCGCLSAKCWWGAV
jgi:hypothetical protein